MDSLVRRTAPGLRDQTLHGIGLRRFLSSGIRSSHSPLRCPVIGVSKYLRLQNAQRVSFARSEARKVHKESSRFLLSGRVDNGGVNDRAFDVGVAEPVLHEAQIGAGFEQMSGDGMFKDMEVSFLFWDFGEFSVLLHQHVELRS